jgi:hypothetical protein
MLLDFPVIGDIVISPNSKVKDEKGNDKYDLLECDGSVVDEGLHPVLSSGLGVNGEFSYTSSIVNLSGIDSTNVLGLVGNSSFMWVMSSDSAYIKKFNVDGDYIEDSFLKGSKAIGLGWEVINGIEYIWRLDWDTLVFIQYTTEGDATGTTFSPNIGTPSSTARGMCRIGDYYYILLGSDKFIYKVDENGDEISNFSVDNEDVRSVTTDGTYVIVFSYATNTVYWYTVEGTLHKSLDTTLIVSNPVGVSAIQGNSLWIVGEEYYRFDQGKSLPDITPLDARTPYKIVGDLT